MQLVLLCRESDLKTFSANVVFSKLVADLKVLESSGISFDNETVKGSLLCIVGDNLGSHMIGGFQESFIVDCFCRFCEIHRNESPINERGSPRTVAGYKNSVTYAVENETVDKGLKSDSVFNSLSFYHVALPGLPPCLGHDLFEGVVSYDMVLIINSLIRLQWFTCEQLNTQIASWKYAGNDALDKPALFSVKSDKLGGHAVQNWVFLRFFSLFVANYVKDVDNEFWQMYLNLKHIDEILCSTSIAMSEIAYVNVCIESYLYDRMRLFPQTALKPKHHYLVHYPELTLAFGPLIHLWTIRFESKHTYFKKCARQLHNFKHLCKTLTERHQFLQAYFACGSLFKNSLIIHGQASPFQSDLFNQAIQTIAKDSGLSYLNTVVPVKVSFRGVEFTTGKFVIIRQDDDGVLLGNIQLLLVKGGSLLFIVTTTQYVHVPSLGTYMNNCILSQHTLENFQCIDAADLKCLFPISVYELNNKCFISLKNI